MSDGFLGRWSRRKIEAKERDRKEGADGERGPEASAQPPGAEETAPVVVDPAVDPAAASAVDEPETLSEEEIAALPPIDGFTLDTDITPFLRRGVPKALKNAAMRKMWLLDPAIRNHRDVALDYAYDWNAPGGVPGNAGAIARDAARKMLDALLPPETPEPPAEPTAESPPAQQVVAEDAVAAAAPAPPAPEEAPVDGAAPESRGGSPLAEAAPERPALARIEAREAETQPRRRRHGGATPA